MSETQRVLDQIRAAIHSVPRFGPRGRVRLALAHGALVIEGEVDDIATKKLLLKRAAAHGGIDGIVDRLRIAPAQCMGDGQIRDLVCDALLDEPALAEVAIRQRANDDLEVVREPPQTRRGQICIAVDDGVVSLTGDAPSLAHKRLAGVLAWWVPGSRDVINGLGTPFPEDERDEEITDVVRLVLEKDPFVNAGQIRVTTRNSVVVLEGLVPADSEREMAEFDAWYVLGVDDVDNRIQVRPES